MLKVLITGANGFVGSHIVRALVENNYRVIALVRQTSNLKWIAGTPILYRYGSLTDINFLKGCVKDVDVVIHCAGVVRSIDKQGYFSANVDNTKRLCEAIVNANPKLKKFVYISSQAAMGASTIDKMRTLDEKEVPVSDYGLSKLEAEKTLKSILKDKVPYTIFRPASVYGPQDKDIFIYFNLVHKHLMPMTTSKRILQLVFVKDVATAIIKSINNPKTDNNTYYLADETCYSWKDVAKTIAKSVDKKFLVPVLLPNFVFRLVGFVCQTVSNITRKPAVLNNQKIDEMLQIAWTCDNTKSKKDLNMEFTKLENGAKITYNWYSFNKYF